MRISLSASAANAAPGSKVETAMSAANARVKAWTCQAPLKKSVCYFN